jgi:hypothetical protein
VGKTEMAGETPGEGALSGSGRTVDGDDHRLGDVGAELAHEFGKAGKTRGHE